MELALIFILFAAVCYWQDSLAKRERATMLGRELAARFQLQLLDESVACTNLWLGRNARGQAQLQRTYEFDVSANGADRLSCHLILLGNQLSLSLIHI